MTKITVLGDRTPEHVTHRALDAALALLPDEVEAGWAATEAALPELGDGLWVAPGSPYRDDDAVLRAIARARVAGVPLLGTCGGFQYTALALSGRTMADHAETTPDVADPFIAPLACRVDGAQRTVTPVAGTRLAALLGDAPFPGTFFCGYAPTAAAAAALEAAGLRISAHAEGVGPVALELPADEHPFLMATLFQPQLGVLDGEPLSPLIAAFAEAARVAAGAAAAPVALAR